jgi:hypothetical protein
MPAVLFASQYRPMLIFSLEIYNPSASAPKTEKSCAFWICLRVAFELT